MPVVVDPNKLQQLLKEMDKLYTKEISALKQSVAKLESRLAAVEKSQGHPKP
jgi:hypothetical protein